MRWAAVFDTVCTAEIGTGDMWNSAFVVANAQIDLWFAEPDRFQLGVNVRDVDQRHVAERIEFQQLILRQQLLGGQLAPLPKTGRTDDGAGSHTGLQKIPTRDHKNTPFADATGDCIH